MALVSLAGVGAATPGLAAEPIVPIVWSTDGEIGRINPDGSGRSVIIAPRDSGHRFFTPDLAPDGSQLVFVDCDPANHHPGSACILAAANVDGSGYRPLGGHRSPRWSPDGKRIAAIRYESDGRVHIVTVMDADGSNRRDLAYVESDSLDWSADGLSIVFGDSKNPEDATAASALFSLPADGSGSRKQLGPDGSYEHPTWSPDGTQIALIRHFNGAGQELSAVAVMNGDGTGLRDVSPPTPRWPGLGRPAWSPDSHSLAFATTVSRSDGNLDTPLDLYDLGDGSVTRVMDNGGGGVSWGNPSGPPSCGSGYWMVGSDGGVFSFGRARFVGSAQPLRLRKPIVGMAASPMGHGYWLVASDGGVFAFGDAKFHGSTGGISLNKPIVGMAAAPTGDGYWLVASDGGVFAFGDAKFYGSTGGISLNKPIVGMAAIPTGDGYWLVASDGGVFAFGDAKFHGSTGGISLNKPIVGMAAAPTGHGYWLVASDGGVFAFGDAAPLGSAASPGLPAPVVASSGGRADSALLMASSDGVVIPFGHAAYCGSRFGQRPTQPVVGIALAGR